MIIENMPSGQLAANTYLVVDEETKKGFVVDPGGYNPRLTKYVKENGFKIEYIILTHGHGDHMGGVPMHMKEFEGAKLIAAKAEKEFLADTSVNFSIETTGKPITLTADKYVVEGDIVEVGDLELRFIITPGHTPGGMCILVEDCLFSGDTLFRESIGRTDFPGGSFEAISKSIKEKLYILPEATRVFPGHMGPTTIGFEKGNNPFV